MQIFWININKLKYSDFLVKLTRDLKKDHKKIKQKIIFTPNPEILLEAKSDEGFKKNLKKADYLVPDGIWLYIAFQILWFNLNTFKVPLIKGVLEGFLNIFFNILLLPYCFFNIFFRKKYLYKKYWEKICWSDLTNDLIGFANDNNIKIAIVDLYSPNDEKKIKSQKNFESKLKARFNNLRFDYFIYNPNKKENIIKEIKNSDSKILFSTLWMKKQEKSVIEIMKFCKNIQLWLWIWSSFDYLTWFQKRAPKIFRRFWLEWLYRLFTWPQKIKRIKRLYSAIFIFLWKIIK
jgi:N-acetylglucosaminyldiphosphoundecaprenol N-acetyl-beta-D-mannosaminyltransferase